MERVSLTTHIRLHVAILTLANSFVASHLSPEERKLVVSKSRQALIEAGLGDEPLLVGTGGGSAQTTIQIAKEAKEAGATHSIVICPGKSHETSLRRNRNAKLI